MLEIVYVCVYSIMQITLPETNGLHLNMDGWKTIVSFWGPGLFSGANC